MPAYHEYIEMFWQIFVQEVIHFLVQLFPNINIIKYEKGMVKNS